MKVILDLDTGIDDSMALAYMVGSSQVELIGVTGTYGNVYTQQGVDNVVNILEMFGKKTIPVCPGARHAMNKKEFERLEVSARIHGENGVGDVSISKAEQMGETIDGVDFLIQSIKQYGKDLTIVGTGPMTNMALAIKKAPEIKTMLGPVIVMGGALTVPGNVNAYAEANVYQDPQAAKELFESGVDMTMVGLDVTQRSQLTLLDTAAFRALGTKSAVVYAEMIEYYIKQHEHSGGTACFLHDPSAAVYAVHPEYFHVLPMHMTVVTEGESAGRTVGDATRLRQDNPNVKVCVGVDSVKLELHLKEILQRCFLDTKKEEDRCQRTQTKM